MGRTRSLLVAYAAVFMAGLLAGCASLAPREPPASTHALADVAGTALARVAASSTPADVGGKSGFRMLPEGPFSLDARIALARRAEKSLDVQYYQLQSDSVGFRLLRELRDAARRGVRVRLIVDDFYTAGQDELFSTLAAFSNVEVRLFNPLPAREGSLVGRFLASLHEFSRINHRMHNKLFVADNSFSVSGGRNIGDEYFMQGGAANFIDADVMAAGPVVREQSAAFDLYWNSEHVWPVAQVARPALAPEQARRRFDEIVGAPLPDIDVRERDVLGHTPVREQLARGRLDLMFAHARVLVDDPSKITRSDRDARLQGSVSLRVLDLMDSARSKVLIISPYFIPGKLGMARLARSAANGVKLTVYTNSLSSTDEPLVYLGYARYRDDLLRLGFDLYEVAPQLGNRTQLGVFGSSISRLHAKISVIDEDRIFVGSMNLDSRSARINTEIGLVVESPEIVREFMRMIPADGFKSAYRLRLSDAGRVEWLERTDDGGVIVHKTNPGTTWMAEIRNWLSSLFVGEDQL
ncbi:phospholipase D family protein [Pseudorhodoferax sp. Leaf267]|uniref:phospholipase D family protein n=1 Tax=Pseudorhodoferax sp. Leaf267 TaxID=1736316 RepID=UPI0006F8A2CC|nr:phospholipase D family protein [Pseudorhodoferax sp. Leaf267]KQP20061.1 phospholipase [Pseudorhodoferax sp. Leaf267]